MHAVQQQTMQNCTTIKDSVDGHLETYGQQSITLLGGTILCCHVTIFALDTAYMCKYVSNKEDFATPREEAG